MTDLIRAVDVSEYTTTIPHSWWRTVRDRHGVEAAVIQAWGGGYIPGRRNEHLGQHLEGALEAELGVAVYVWPPRDYEPAFRWIEQSGYKDELALYAHDVEAGAGVFAECVGAADQWLGCPSWIYASPGSWRQIMGAATRSELLQYADHPLWLARYPLSPERVGGNTVWWPRDSDDPFGGYEVGAWQAAQGWQFQGTTHIDGESCDLNLFNADAFLIPQTGDDDDMWLDKMIVGFDGQPILYAVLQGDLTTARRTLTHRGWLQLSELGLLVGDQPTSDVPTHSHSGRITVE